MTTIQQHQGFSVICVTQSVDDKLTNVGCTTRTIQHVGVFGAHGAPYASPVILVRNAG